ncbi:beta-ketoacyl synthase N-terminal-like domain-containing protein [Vibrio cholerae]|uniref:beta-ketoacyl synthase N-terminal-like domain-containing protein n=1 Tax=Vibrio cholerae TaxID=666 RepID=UPI00307FF754
MTSLFIKNASAISPLGSNLSEIWQNVLSGRSGFGHVTLLGKRHFFAAESYPGCSEDIADYAPLYYAAIQQLISELHLEKTVDAIFFATAVGNLADVEKRIYASESVNQQDIDFSNIKEFFAQTSAVNGDTKYICVPTGCCAGLQAIGLAKSVMPRLGLKTAIVMSLDFGLTPLAFEAFNKINATIDYQPDTARNPSRPFCKDRSGFLFADGGGAILVSTEPDEQDHPRITGYGCVSSAYHMTDIATDGSAIRSSIEKALKDSGLNGDDIDHVNLHASGTQQNDEAEYNALLNVIGQELPLITAFKGNHGHALGGANMIEIALSWKMLQQNIVPPTPEGLAVDAYPQVVSRSQPVPFEGKTILKTASGFSGIHAALVMEK